MLYTCIRLLSVVLFTLVRHFKAFEFPTNFELCHRNDEECIVRRANEIIREHPYGYPDIFLQEFEPFRLKKLEVTSSQNSLFNINLQMTDLVVHGYSNMTFSRISGFDKEPSGMQIETESSINPRVSMHGRYKISGRFLFFPISGEGSCKITLQGLKIKTNTKPTVNVRNGKIYLKPSSYKLHVDTENMKIHLTNLFNGDKLLSEYMLRIINDNWKLIWNEMSPKFSSEIAAANVKIFEAMFDQIPYDDMFLSY